MDGLNLVQKIDVGENILDVAFHENIMYLSVDAKGKEWIHEYQFTSDGFIKVDTERWNTPEMKVDTKAQLYWLDSMRKKIRTSEED